MKNLLIIFLTLQLHIFAQENDIVKAIRLVPLYCLQEVLERPNNTDIVIANTETTIDESCVDRVRITFMNSDMMSINNIFFNLIILEKTVGGEIPIYKARHEINIKLLPDEVKSYDLMLSNKISPPEGEDNFKNKSKWSWNLEIIKMNIK